MNVKIRFALLESKKLIDVDENCLELWAMPLLTPVNSVHRDQMTGRVSAASHCTVLIVAAPVLGHVMPGQRVEPVLRA